MASESREPTRIMVAVNQSTLKGYPHTSISSKGAFEWTLHKIIRSNTSGFKLLILHVQVPDEDGKLSSRLEADGECDMPKQPTNLDIRGFDGVDSIYASPEDFKSLRQRDKNNGLQLLHYFVKQCHEIGVACEAWIKTGDAKDLICQEVKRCQPDLLVVGNRGLGPFQKVFVGTVSEFVTKHADCPVISIKRSADQTPQDPAED